MRKRKLESRSPCSAFPLLGTGAEPADSPLKWSWGLAFIISFKGLGKFSFSPSLLKKCCFIHLPLNIIAFLRKKKLFPRRFLEHHGSSFSQEESKHKMATKIICIKYKLLENAINKTNVNCLWYMQSIKYTSEWY